MIPMKILLSEVLNIPLGYTLKKKIGGMAKSPPPSTGKGVCVWAMSSYSWTCSGTIGSLKQQGVLGRPSGLATDNFPNPRPA